MRGGDLLVVDDSSHFVAILSTMLESRGHSVRVAMQGEEALSLARERAPDLVLLDLHMPGLSGFEVCRQLREQWAHLPVLFLSGAHESSDKLRAFQVGAVDYVTKPFALEEVAARVETHLELQRLQLQATERAAELERLNARLTRLEAARRSFLSAVVHDLKNPLTPVLKNSEWLLAQPTADPEVTDVLHDVHVAASHMNRMVLSLLDVARGEEHALEPQHATVSLRAWLNDSLRLARLSLRSRPGRLTATAQDITVRFDPLLMGRVLQNLLDNALKYAPHDTTVVVDAGRDESGLRLSVEDAGPGIASQLRERIFDHWVRGELPQLPVPARISHGLGLAFCKQAVEAHGGSITVEDVAPHGTRFVVRLPTVSPWP